MIECNRLKEWLKKYLYSCCYKNYSKLTEISFHYFDFSLSREIRARITTYFHSTSSLFIFFLSSIQMRVCMYACMALRNYFRIMPYLRFDLNFVALWSNHRFIVFFVFLPFSFSLYIGTFFLSRIMLAKELCSPWLFILCGFLLSPIQVLPLTLDVATPFCCVPMLHDVRHRCHPLLDLFYFLCTRARARA